MKFKIVNLKNAGTFFDSNGGYQKSYGISIVAFADSKFYAQTNVDKIIGKINIELTRRGLSSSFIPAINPHSTIAMVLFNRNTPAQPFTEDLVTQGVASISNIHIHTHTTRYISLEPLFIRFDDRKNISRLTILGKSSEIGNLRRTIAEKHLYCKNTWSNEAIQTLTINFANGYMIPDEFRDEFQSMIIPLRATDLRKWELPPLKLVYHTDSTLNPGTNLWVKDISI